MQRYKLTQPQHLIWIGQQLYAEAPLYNMAFTFTFQEEVSEPIFWKAFDKLIESVDVLRATITMDCETPMMQVADHINYEKQLVDFSDKPETALAEWVTERAQKKLLLEEILFDTALLKNENGQYVWYINQHHLITDGWSVALLYQYFSDIYNQIKQTGTANIAIPKYTDQSLKVDKPDEYYNNYALQIGTPPLYYDKTNASRSTEAYRLTTNIPALKTEALQLLVKDKRLRTWTVDQSMFILFSTVLSVVNARLNRNGRSVFGTPSHGRYTKESKGASGVFIKILPIATEVKSDDTFVTLYQRVRDEINAFLRYAPPAELTADMGNKYHCLLNYINASIVSDKSLKSTPKWLHTGHIDPSHHFRVQVYDFKANGDLQLTFDFVKEVFDEKLCQPIADMFVDVLTEFLSDLESPISTISKKEKEVLAEFNTTKNNWTHDKTILDLYKAQVAANPDLIAIKHKSETLTFRELDEQSSNLAVHLVQKGVGRGDLVTVCLDRSLAMSVSLLAIIKCGAAYVPIDPTYPQVRKDYIMAHSGTKLIITTDAHSTAFAGVQIVNPEQSFDKIDTHILDGISPFATDLMYVIYTSGSTGQPKGVMNQHDGVVNRLRWAAEYFGVKSGESTFLQKTNYCFDVSVWELFLPLITGNKLVYAEAGKQGDPAYLANIINDEDITMIHFVPPMLEVFLMSAEYSLPSLKQIVCSGEKLKTSQVNLCRAKLPVVQLHNLYGPTEAAIDVTATQVLPNPNRIENVTIGKPVANTKIFILDENVQMCGVGTQGEICLSGIQVARGYNNDEKRTKAVFIDNLYGEGNYERLYKTGDIGYWAADGNIVYVGRKDFQVKVRGYRIELGEIESKLDSIAGIKQSVVLVKESEENKQIIAFVNAEGNTDANKINAQLLNLLPEYMVPQHIEFIDTVPVTHNDKIDRRALLAMPLTGSTDQQSKVAPADEFEEMIYEVWHAVLGKDMSVTDSFFALGGDSISGIKVVLRVNEAFELTLPVTTIFRHTTIRAMANHVQDTIISLMEA